jgi:outer membrane protein TolC
LLSTSVSKMFRDFIHIVLNDVGRKFFFIFLFIFSFSFILFSQAVQDTLPAHATLNECLRYALQNQPYLKRALLDEAIYKQNSRIALADWMPQLGVNALYQYNFQLPVTLTSDPTNPNGTITTGKNNVAYTYLYASQVLFNNDVLHANRSAGYNRQQASQMTESKKIDIVMNVSKAFYDVSLTIEQLNLIGKSIERLNRNMKDAYNLYQNGLTDKIDYKRATIALNNAFADKKYYEESIKGKLENLKQQMGCPINKELVVLYDSAALASDIMIDTMQILPYQNRIEFKILQTQMKLQQISVSYYKMNFLPSVNAFANKNLIFQNNNYSDLFIKNYPNSYAGINLSFPIFQGTKRLHYIKRANFQYQQLQQDTIAVKSEINTEYARALGTYKSNLMIWRTMHDNAEIAREVYNLVKFQYEQGIKTYLDVIVSETDLRSSEINELNALFFLLSGKLDVQHALGNISLTY